VFGGASVLSLVHRKCVPLRATVQVTQSKAAMSDTDFHRLHRKYCNANVANSGKQEDCGQRDGAKIPDTTKSPQQNPGKDTEFCNVSLST